MASNSSHNQPPQYRGYTTFLAEIASTCNEALLTNHLLDRYDDDTAMKLLLLNQRLLGEASFLAERGESRLRRLAMAAAVIAVAEVVECDAREAGDGEDLIDLLHLRPDIAMIVFTQQK